MYAADVILQNKASLRGQNFLAGQACPGSKAAMLRHVFPNARHTAISNPGMISRVQRSRNLALLPGDILMRKMS